ncbi:2-hydroxy-3-oxopropionate reductase [Shinella sp. BYT-45]|uniref:2-hydroxy-3-oxopropionate reductase n=1 Tax=Shinella sp. BYT-45 TaxID=3377377 RepID=UPI0039818A86
MTKIGFVGLGIMGKPMALNLLAAGYELSAYGRRGVPEDAAGAGVKPVASGRALAESCDVVITMVPDTPDVQEVLFGADGIAEGLSAGKTVVDMSSISPMATRDFAVRVQALGADYLDAPVSGGETGARAATLSIMVGGAADVFERIRPVFEVLGKNITHVGENGAGQVAKVANQIIVALTIEAVGEALLLASKAGVDPGRVRKALLGGFAHSRILEVHGLRMIERTFEPGFRIELNQKDVALALQTAGHLGMSLPNTATVQQLFNACVASGGRHADHSGLIRALEQLAGHELPDFAARGTDA